MGRQQHQWLEERLLHFGKRGIFSNLDSTCTQFGSSVFSFQIQTAQTGVLALAPTNRINYWRDRGTGNSSDKLLEGQGYWKQSSLPPANWQGCPLTRMKPPPFRAGHPVRWTSPEHPTGSEVFHCTNPLQDFRPERGGQDLLSFLSFTFFFLLFQRPEYILFFFILLRFAYIRPPPFSNQAFCIGQDMRNQNDSQPGKINQEIFKNHCTHEHKHRVPFL